MDSWKLRNFREDDFEAMHAMASDYDVVAMMGSWPYPADPDFTRMRMNTPEAKAGQVSAVEVDGSCAGIVGGVNGSLGYMLAREFWGRGIATWAVRQKLVEMFKQTDTDEVTACIWQDNPASATVLRKNGFSKIGESEDFCKARDKQVKYQSFRVARHEWADTQPLDITTERLRIEPFTGTEAAELSSLMNDAEIASMMATIPHPFTEPQAAAWLAERPFQHSMDSGFGAKISLYNGTLIGFVGIGGEPVNTAYALGRAHWGQGYATEAMRGFLDHTIQTFGLKEITAGVMFDNPASQRVLDKLGFDKVGEKPHKPSGRLEKATLFLYRLGCNDRTAP